MGRGWVSGGGLSEEVELEGWYGLQNGVTATAWTLLRQGEGHTPTDWHIVPRQHNPREVGLITAWEKSAALPNILRASLPPPCSQAYTASPCQTSPVVATSNQNDVSCLLPTE